MIPSVAQPEPHRETGPISGSLRRRQRQTHKRRGIWPDARTRLFLHAAKALRQHKQQRDDGEENGKLDIELSFFFSILWQRVRAGAVTIWVL
jgi:hypothetical protein